MVSASLKTGAKSGVNARSGEKRWSPLHHAALDGHKVFLVRRGKRGVSRLLIKHPSTLSGAR